jgi:hypothetical protein
MKVKLRPEQKRMRDAVRRMRKYMNTYPKQDGYMDYSDYTFIEDILYGIGIALEPDKHAFATGFDAFKTVLREHLGGK